MFAAERGISERAYMRRYTLRDLLRHGRAMAWRVFLPFQPVLGALGGLGGGDGDGEGDDGGGGGDAPPSRGGGPPRAPRRRRKVGLPPGYKPMSENVNVVDLDGPLSPILAAAQAMIR